jgi:hypothetical protein
LTHDDTYGGQANQIYHTQNDSWTLGVSLPNSTRNAAAVATTGVMAPKKIYVIGGGFIKGSDSVLVYDPELRTWIFGAPMLTGSRNPAVAAVNDTVYAFGGASDYQGTFPVGGYVETNAVAQYIPLGYGTIPPVTTKDPEPFPTSLVIPASGASAAIIGVGLLVYFKKRNH